MPIFKIKNSKVNPIKEKRIELESNIQRLTENNLGVIFGWEFVTSELQVSNFFIDTLAFDPENKAFIIIEYKKDKSFSVVDQGVAYLSQMLDNQDTFILEYNERLGKNLRRKDVDWSQSQVVFIADSFTNYQQNAIGFRDLPIELWEVKIFEEDLVSYFQLKPLTTKGSIKTLTKDRTIQKISEQLIYPLSYHLDHIKNQRVKDLFEKVKDEVQNLGNVEETPRKYSIGYWKDTVKFLVIRFYQDHLTLWIRIQGYKLDDPQHLTKLLNRKSEYWRKIYKEIHLKSPNQISDVIYLIKQAYDKAEQRVK